MKFIDLFSGIGGFSLPLTEIGHECIGFSEIDKYAILIYKKHFPTHECLGDIKSVDPTRLPNFDLIVGGFPCQSFSIAGKRGGFDDTRGTLFFEIARIARIKSPRLLLLENVKGLLSHDGGRTFDTIIRTLDELGYDIQWQVLNSKNFGVPQNRERVFIIGHLRGTARPEIFPLREDTNPIQIRIIGTTKGMHNTRIGERDNVYDSGGIMGSLKATDYKQPPQIMLNGRIRKLTPLEHERLQGFPSDWTEGVSDTQRYKCLGNAVTVNVIKAIIERF